MIRKSSNHGKKWRSNAHKTNRKKGQRMKDKLGFEIPAHIEALWQEAETTGHKIAGECHRIKMLVQKALERRDLSFREVNQQTVIDLENAWRSLCLILPYAV